MPVTNVVEAILGREELKWDALWRLFTWLLDPTEGHELGAQVLAALTVHVFGRAHLDCQIKREFQLSRMRDGKGKWPDLAIGIPSLSAPTHVIVMDDVDRRSSGGRRKLENLAMYRTLARDMYPHALIRAVVLTNADHEHSLRQLYAHAGPEAVEFSALDGWRLLPLRVVGAWVEAALKPERSDTMSMFLRDFVAWTQSLDVRRDRPRRQ